MKCVWLAVVTMFLLAGCAVEGPAYERLAVKESKAAIYVYRTYPTAGFGAGAQSAVNCGDNSVTLGPGGYHRFTVEPGDVLCSSHTENSAQVQIHALAGQDYFIRQWFSMGLILPHVYLEQVEPDTAQADIQGCKQM